MQFISEPNLKSQILVRLKAYRDWPVLVAERLSVASIDCDAPGDRHGEQDQCLGPVLSSELFNLEGPDSAVFDVLALYAADASFEALCDTLVSSARMRSETVIAVCADLPSSRVRQSLCKLFEQGIAGPQGSGTGARFGGGSPDFFAFSLNRRLSQALESLRSTVQEVRESLFGKPVQTKLILDDFEHIGEPLDIAIKVLRAAFDRHEKGINILLHGAPGTGKTELSQVLAAHLSVALYSVAVNGDGGSEPSRSDRLDGLKLAQSMLRGTGDALILFDEMEDLFERGAETAFGGFTRTPAKAYLNRLLEENAVPIIWTLNEVGEIDPAFLRRMTFAIDMGVPPAVARERVWQRASEAAAVPLSPDAIARYCRSYSVSPAVIGAAVRVAHLTGGGEPAVSLALKGVGRLAESASNGARPHPGDHQWIPDLQSADLSLDACVGRLKASGFGDGELSVLVTGPQGSGKTTYLRQLAQALGLPTLEVEAVDLMSDTLAKARSGILEVVREARNSGQFLLIDNVQVLLQDLDRQGGQWEASFAREIVQNALTLSVPLGLSLQDPNEQETCFERHVLAKVRCGPLSAKARGVAFETIFGRPLSGQLLIPSLTIGDFFIAARRADFAAISDVPRLIRLVNKIGEAREGHIRQVGFHSQRTLG